MANEFGYHTVKIAKGILGTSSKLQEELDELQDAERQGVKILLYCEMADLYGALQAYAEDHGLTMSDLSRMAELNANAFAQGHR